jgi:hypothetical protein
MSSDAGQLAERLRADCGAFLEAFILGLPPAAQQQMHSALKGGERLALVIELQPQQTISVVSGSEVLAVLKIAADPLH